MQIDKLLFEKVGINEEKSQELVRPSLTYFKDAWRRLKKDKFAMISLCLLITITLCCILIPIFSQTDPTAQILEKTNQPPSTEYWFGLDNLGRDIFARIWIGGRVSLLIGFIGTIVSLSIGVLYGGIAGYLGGRTDMIMMRIVEVISGIPYLIVVILVSIRLEKGLGSFIIALCITSWTGPAMLVRGQVMQLKENEYILAARSLGVDPLKVVLRHMVPNMVGVLIVNITFSVPSYIFAEAFLSFLGLGVQPPNTSWGLMVALGQQQFVYYPHELLFPALAISIVMLSFNLLGNGLRDALDPKLRS